MARAADSEACRSQARLVGHLRNGEARRALGRQSRHPARSRRRAAVLAFGDELVDPKLPNDPVSQWLSQGGRDMAAAHLLPRAETALRQELQRLTDTVKRAREGQSSSSSSSRAL
jgi:hypothetical protein